MEVIPVLAVDNLSLIVDGRALLENASFSLSAGESLAIQGRSGSGKSTLLNAILGLFKPKTGTICVDGHQVEAGRRSAVRLRRESMGMIFQAGELLDDLTPMENIEVAALLAGQDADTAHSSAESLLQALEVPARDNLVGTFSGGEQQRVAIARALINQPTLLLADEPTGSLDPQTRDDVLGRLHRLPQEHNCALVIVTHDPIVADSCDRQASLVDQRLVLSSQAAL